MNRYITEEEYQKQLKKIQHANQSIERKIQLKKEKNKYSALNKLPSTSKLMAVYLFFLLNTVLAYAMYAMWHFQDLQYLGVLITDVVGQILIYYIYTKKATMENTQGGIVYETVLQKLQSEQIIEKEDCSSIDKEEALG